jgi:CheY-like chemotaxis protein
MPKKILLADDSLTIQKVVELTFSDSDFELTCVSNGQRALEKVREERPDLILADVVMPEKNGYEVCEAIKGNPGTAKIPVVLLSGTFEPFDRQRAERIGADAIVSKPFDSQQLLAQVEALLAKSAEAAASPPSAAATTVSVPMAELASPGAEDVSPSARQATEPVARPSEEPAPFEAGFTAEDFTGNVRRPSPVESQDPFEEEYGRAGVDSAIEELEAGGGPGMPAAGAFAAEEIEIDEVRLTGQTSPTESAAPVAWFQDEPGPLPPIASTTEAPSDAFDLWGGGESVSRVAPPSEKTVALRGPLTTQTATPTDAVPAETVALKGPLEMLAGPPGAPPEPPITQEAAARHARPEEEEHPHELEALASGATIPELTEMLSSVVKKNGDLTEADIERIATRVVQLLSDKIVREIAWEVIPDMAEIVIKQRIKELESGVE